MPRKAACFILITVIMAAVFLVCPPSVSGSQDLGITIDGQKVPADTAPYIDDNGRTMVPVRFVSEALGLGVFWEEESRKVRVTSGSSVVELSIDDRKALVNGEEKVLDSAAVIRNKRTMVPLRFLSETFGMYVDWFAETRTVALGSGIIMPETEKGPLPASVTGSAVNVRTGPGTEFPRLDRLDKGTELTLVGQTADWYRVLFPVEEGSKEGWIAGRLLEVKEPPPEDPEEPEEKKEKEDHIEEDQLPVEYHHLASSFRTALVMKSVLNVRSSPGLTYPVIDQVYFGDRLRVTGQREQWYQVDLPDGRKGWIAGWMVATLYENERDRGALTGARGVSGTLLKNWDGAADPEKHEELEAAGKAVITGLEVTQTDRGVSIKVKANSYLEMPHVFRLTGPSRLVMDFPAVLVDSDLSTDMKIDSRPVSGVRAAQFNEDTVRVVADLISETVHSAARRHGDAIIEITLEPVFPLHGTVVIDPGHGTMNDWGNSDPGAIGPTGVKERDVVLNISRMLGEILLEEGFSVLFTREQDTGLTLLERSLSANQSGGLFVSIHANAHPNPQTAGTMTFYPSSREGASRELLEASKTLAGHIQAELLSELKRPDKGIREAGFSVLRNTHIPAALVEVAFLSNSEEEKLLKDPRFQYRAARAIARGIKNYMSGADRI